MRARGTWVVMALLLGCGTERGGFVSGEDPAAVVSSLTDAQAVDLCLAMLDHYDVVNGANALPRALCLSSGVTEADAVACESERAACLETLVFDPSVRLSRCSAEITAARSGCTATVGEVERCIDETTAMLGEALGGSCADAPIASVGGTRYDTGSPPACLALDARCSELVLQSSRVP